MLRRISVLAVVPLLILGLSSPALATGPVMPPTIPNTPLNQFFYNMWFGPPDPEWTPQGTVVADSGFRPTPNGFPYVNYGGSFDLFNLFFDMPDNALQPMTSPYMRSLYGDGVCAGPVESDGSCNMTPAAAYMSEAILDQVDGVGHCVGFAITTAGLFNGQIEPTAVAAQTLALQSKLTLDTQNVIARNWATQMTTQATSLTPTQVVEQLIEDFQNPGTVANIIQISWTTDSGGHEGHGITPYAIYDKGNGQYDIAIYDNNYPFQERAIHVDTVADTWEYLVLLNPSAPPIYARGDATTKSLQLQSVAESLATQPCQVCRGGRDTNLVLLSPLPTAVAPAIVVNLLDAQGNILPQDRASVLPAVDSGNPDLVGFPAFDIDPGDGFVYVVDTAGAPSNFPLAITDLSVNGVKQGSIASFPAGAQAFAEFDIEGVFAFGANQPVRPRMERVITEGARHYTSIVWGGQSVSAENGRSITVKSGTEAIYYGDSEAEGGSMTVTVELNRGGVERKFRAVNVAYPQGGQLVLDYSNWKRTSQRPAFGVDIDGDGVIDQTVRMKRVR
jgi:hypothetical protein